MLIAARNGFWAGKRLPYDAEVEYLESTGTQYIDTGLLTNPGYVSFKLKQTKVSSGYPKYFGGLTVDNKLNRLLFYASGNSSYADLNLGAAGHINFSDIKSNPVEKNSLFYRVNGDTGLASICIFNNRYLQGEYGSGGYARFWYFRIADADGNLVFDGQPVRFTNENGEIEGAMYDRANPTVGMNPDGSPRTDGLYRNLGAGAFVIGPDK